MNHSTLKETLAVIGSTLVLGACGGGGGGSSAPTVELPAARSVAASSGADLSDTNFVALTSPAIQALLASVGGSGALEQPLSLERSSAQSAPGFKPGKRLAQTLITWSLGQAQSRLDALAPREQLQALSSGSEGCSYGGSFSFTLNDADGNQQLSTGDSLTINFFNCVEIQGEPAVNGGFSITVNAVELDTAKNPVRLDATVSFNALSVQGLGSLTGSARLWEVPVSSGGTHSVLRYSGMQSTFGSTAAILDFDVDEVSTGAGSTASINGGLAVQGQTYQLAQRQPFAGTADGQPDSGTLSVIDAQGDRVDIIAHGLLVDREFYLSGATTPTAVLRDTPWSSFTQAQ